MRRFGLGAQLGVAFAVVAALTAMLAAGISTWSWQNTFDDYVRERVQSDANYLANYAASTWETFGGTWNPQSLAQIASIGAVRGLRVQVLDEYGNVLVDSITLTVHSTMPGVPGPTIGQPTGTGSPSFPMTKPVVSVPVYVDETRVGSVLVSSASPGTFLTDQDVRFRNASSSGLLIAALLAVALATAGGVAYSRIFSRPIEKVTRTAAALRADSRDARTEMTGDDPVGVLGRTLDEMADAIQTEREFERRFTADVAHELRTPLQAIQATVEAMQDGVLPADSEHLGIVRDETVRLGRLAHSILELSRLENRTAPMRAAPLDPAVPLSRSVETHRALLESLDLELVEDIEEGATVIGDSDRLTQAFGNLIANAAHYTPAGGTVAVRLAISPTNAVATVRDTGIGIDESDRDRAFDRFWRSEGARERVRAGFGVGLSIVREILGQHGGDVSLAANEGGPGTTVTVRLPLAERSGRQTV